MKDFKECIIYEDAHMIVCHKPPGVPVQSAGVGTMDLECACLNYLQKTYIGIVQRLDQPVEGLMVLAKTRKAAGELSRQVQDGRMEKRYLALVQGHLEPSEGLLQDQMVKDGRSRMGRIVPPHTKGAKEARLRYQVLAESGGQSLLEIRLLTGRFHQIRVQLSSRGCPLVGDRKYGYQGGVKAAGLALCAYRLRLFHPVSGKEMRWEIQPGGDVFPDLQV